MPSYRNFMRWTTALVLGFVPALQAAELLGAGASLPAPVYSTWTRAYQTATNNKIVYQSIGSGNGVAQIIAKSVDFGTSDIPLSVTALDQHKLLQFPTVLTGVVPIVNLPNMEAGELKLSGPVLADIYLGKISKWNDTAITQLNGGRSLPNMEIAVIRRSDGAGATYLLSNYLSKVSLNWRSRVGEGTTVQWPVGLGGKGDDGVLALVQRLPGAIGYVDYTYAQVKKTPSVQMQNQSGAFVVANESTLKAAVGTQHWEDSEFSAMLTEQPAKDAWPITGATFVILRKTQDKPQQGREVIKFFTWAYKNGNKLATDTSYVPLPDTTVQAIQALWKTLRDPADKPLVE